MTGISSKYRKWFHKKQYIQPSFIRAILFTCFLLSVITFPLGQAFRVGGPLVCFPLLVWLYLLDWENATLRVIPVRWLCVIFAIGVSLQVLCSQWISISWAAVCPNIFRGFIMFFVSMETVRSEKELRWLIYSFAGVFFYEGIDGIWQALVGKDFIHKTAIMDRGRLTGSLGTYRIGNYMAIIALPAFGLCLLLPQKNKILFFFIISIIFIPGTFLLIGSQTRIGYLGVFLGGYFLWLCVWTRFSWKKVFIPPLLLITITLFIEIFFIQDRSIFSDPRIKIWSKALSVGLEHFWLGTGSSTFMLAVAEQDKSFLEYFSVDLGHPHNMYIQFFIDGGILGVLCFFTFIWGMTYWAWKYIHRYIALERQNIVKGYHWRLTSFFFGGWIAYLGTGLGAHDFYRTWWLSIAAIILGSLLGACWWGKVYNQNN